MATVAVGARMEAVQRALAPRPFWGVGCLRVVVAAWPRAFDGMSAGAVVRAARRGGLREVLDTIFPARTHPRFATVGDPALVRLSEDGLSVCAIRLSSGYLVSTRSGPVVMPLHTVIVDAMWSAAPCPR